MTTVHRTAGLRPLALLLIVVSLAILGPAKAEADRGMMDFAFQQLEQVSGLEFQREVPYREQTPEEFQVFLEKEMEKSFPGDELEQLGRLYAILGLVPLDYRLERELADLYKDQVGAYYDPETQSIIQVAGEMDRSAQVFLYLHEGVHALQDQHFNLKEKQQRHAREGSLDEQIAFSFVTEGHANLVAMAAQMGVNRLNERFFNNPTRQYIFELTSRLTDLESGQLDMITRLLGEAQSPAAESLRKLRGVPLVLVQQMTDPYLVGQNIWFRRSKRHGHDRVLDWLRNPPTSTQEIFFEGDVGYDDNPFPRIGDYETTFGSYLMMRWLKVFSDRPDWLADVRYDRLSLLGSPDDRAVLWRISFRNAQSRERFNETLTEFFNGDEGESNRFQRGEEVRYMWYRQTEDDVRLLIDDDLDVRPEIEGTGLSLESYKSDFAGDGER